MPVTVRALLAELEGLDHHRRVVRMVELGRVSRTDPGVRTLLAGMAGADWYQRFLAVHAGYGSADAEATRRAAADASHSVRKVALGLLTRIGGDDLLAELLGGLAGAAQRRFAGLLARRGRRRVVDIVVRRLAGTGDPAAARLLRSATAGTAAELAPALLDPAGWADWHSLAEQHPAVATAALRQAAEGVAAPDQRIASRASAVLGPLGERAPDLALQLLTELDAHLGWAPLHRLALRRPAQVADLVLAASRRTDFPAVPTALRRLDHDRLVRLARAGQIRPDARLLRRLTPPARAALFRATGPAWQDRTGAVPVEWLSLLDGPTRDAEARRHLALPQLRSQPDRRLRYAALLPWDDAAAELAGALDDPDAELRAVALDALIGVARYRPERLPAALALVEARRREQDPVRSVMLTALAALPPGRWAAEHLDGLGRIVRAALDAADCSAATAGAAQRLVVGLVATHPEWAGGWLAAIARARGSLQGGLADRLSDADVRRVAPALAPVLAAWAPRERDHATLATARAFGRRLRVFDELAEQVVQVAWKGDAAHAGAAVQLVAAELPERMPALVPDLLADDPTWVAVDAVAGFLHRHRQDLLTPHLGRRAYRGRFGTGRTRLVLGLRSGFHRWTAAQQEEFAGTLAEVARDPERDVHGTLSTITALAALPAVAPDRLAALAAVDGAQPARDAALRALARLDSGAGVPVLLGALEDERAPVAVYALGPAVRAMPAARALEVLHGIDSARLTVAKEVARLLGELPAGAGHPDLMDLLDRPRLHRDLRVAVLRALWEHVERPGTLAALEAAVADPDPAVAGAVLRIPVDRATAAGRRAVRELLAALLGHPSERIRIEVLRRCRQLPLGDPDDVLGLPLLAALGSPLLDEVQAASDAVLHGYAERDPARIGAVVDRILADRAALELFLVALGTSARWQRTRYAPTVRTVLERLATDPLTATHRAHLAVVGLGAAEAAARLRTQAQDGTLHADAVSATCTALGGWHGPGFRTRLEERLTAEPDERLRRIALAALVAAAEGGGWTAGRRERLTAYRADPSPLVAGAAQFTFPPDDRRE